jgi:hypothetical protein
MWAKWVVRVLAVVYIVGGVATLLAPEAMGRFTRWFVNHPLLMRLDGLAVTALGALLALREYREEKPPPPWWQRIFRGGKQVGRR